ncbi:MAG: iron permease [Azospirillum sp.]|nr:iron permease [Azospirillum sp.]
MSHRSLAAALVFFVLSWGCAQAAADTPQGDRPDYPGMVERIGVLLDGAVADVRSGDRAAAKLKAQRAYFEIFENLEGPVRVNVSARKNIELESEFGEIRRIIVAGEPAEAVAARVANQMAELRGVLPALAAGIVLRGERAAAAPPPDPNAEPAGSRPAAIEPHWSDAVNRIAAALELAATTYQAGDAEAGRRLITEAEFDGYKNSLLETAIRRFVSQQQDAEFLAEFDRIGGLIRDGKPARMVQASGVVMVEDLRSHLPGLPLVGLAKAEAAPAGEPAAGDWRAVADQIAAALGRAVERAGAGNSDEALTLAQDSYFDLFEGSGMERMVGARDADFKSRLEGHFSRIMAGIRAGAGAAALAADLGAMAQDFDRAVDLLGGHGGGESPIGLFLYALTILLREGFEALLIVSAILAYLVKTGNADKQGVIYNSVGVAVVASLVTAVVVKWLFQASAASQEVLEGGTMLGAAVVLFGMSFWLISKAEAERWMAYIKNSLSRSVSSGSLAALWFTSFLAVYREGAETVLFYQALATGTDATGTVAIAGGFAAGCLGLGLVYLAMRYGAMKLAIRPFFLITGSLLYVLAVVFAGKGMMELIEGKVFEPTLISWAPELPALGLFPYWQTLAPQGLLIAAALAAAAQLQHQRSAAPNPSGSR